MVERGRRGRKSAKKCFVSWREVKEGSSKETVLSEDRLCQCARRGEKRDKGEREGHGGEGSHPEKMDVAIDVERRWANIDEKVEVEAKMCGDGCGKKREREKRGRGEGVKQQSLELRANYCNCNLDSKRRDTAVTGSHSLHTLSRTKQRRAYACVCLRLCVIFDLSGKLQMCMHTCMCAHVSVHVCVHVCVGHPFSFEWQCRIQPANQLLYACQFKNIS